MEGMSSSRFRCRASDIRNLMRNNIVSLGADELKYEIREIVAVAKEFGKLGLEIMWENIGDPVQKGEKIPDWIK